MIDGERIRARLATLGKSQADLARFVGVTPQAISKIVNGDTNDSAKLHKIARFLDTSPEFLSRETDDVAPVGTIAETRQAYGALPSIPVAAEAERTLAAIEELGLVAIDEISLEFGMGATVLHDEHETVRRYLPAEWVAYFTKSHPSLIRVARGRGDSMYPTIMNGELVVIDLGDTTMTAQDELWAVGYGDLGGLKRLRSIGGGQIKVMSDNPQVSDEVFDMEELRIIGRVCGNLRRI